MDSFIFALGLDRFCRGLPRGTIQGEYVYIYIYIYVLHNLLGGSYTNIDPLLLSIARSRAGAFTTPSAGTVLLYRGH